MRRGIPMIFISDDVSCLRVKGEENCIVFPCPPRGHFQLTWHLGPALGPVLRVSGAPNPTPPECALWCMQLTVDDLWKMQGFARVKCPELTLAVPFQASPGTPGQVLLPKHDRRISLCRNEAPQHDSQCPSIRTASDPCMLAERQLRLETAWSL